MSRDTCIRWRDVVGNKLRWIDVFGRCGGEDALHSKVCEVEYV